MRARWRELGFSEALFVNSGYNLIYKKLFARSPLRQGNSQTLQFAQQK
jgi:hypothetical protein